MAFEPDGHLWEFILPVCCIPSVLRKIYVKTFSIFSIIIICCAKQLDTREIMIEKMEFGDVEIVAYSQVYEDAFVIVELLQSILKKLERLSCMHRILGQEKEIE